MVDNKQEKTKIDKNTYLLTNCCQICGLRPLPNMISTCKNNIFLVKRKKEI
jgi:hypothetical protein